MKLLYFFKLMRYSIECVVLYLINLKNIAEVPIFWPPDGKSWLTGKDPDAGKDWRQEEKGTTEDEMVGWHHRLDGYESEQAPGVGDGQGNLVYCSPWGPKESDMTKRLNWTELNIKWLNCFSKILTEIYLIY